MGDARAGLVSSPVSRGVPSASSPRAASARSEFSNGRTARWLPPACGAAAVALGLLVMTAWHLGSDRVLRVFPGYRPMVYLSAICFVLCGTSLVLRLRTRSWLSGIPAALAAAAAAMAPSQNVRLTTNGVEAWILPRAAQSDPSLYRMAPITAASFFLVGLALAFAAGRKFPRRPLFMGIAGAVTFCFSWVVLVGYLTGTSGYMWSPLTGMALLTAGGLLLLAVAVLVLSHADGGQGLSKRPPWILIVGGLAATLSMWGALVAQNRSFVERTVRVEADSLASKLSAEIRARSLELFRMSKRWEQRGDVPRSEWEADVRWQYAHYPGFQALEWSDTSLHVRWVVPVQGNESEIGLDLRADPMRRRALDRTLATGAVTVSRAVRIPPSGSGFLIFSPVTAGPASGSVLVSILRLGGLCDAIFRMERSRGTPFALLEGTREIYRSGTPAFNAASYSQDALADPDTLPVRVRVWPSADLLESRSRLPTVALLFGLLITALLALSVRLALTTRDRAYDAEALNRSLSAEILERHKAETAVAERIRLANFAAEVGAALTRHATLENSLAECADAMVRLLGASTASVWTMNDRSNELELAGSAGFAETLPGSRNRVALGEHRLGRIARDQKPMHVSLEDVAAFDDDKNWARDRGMVSFAGYPLLVGRRTVGVVAIFSDRSLSAASIEALASVADGIALGIDRSTASAALVANEERTRAVIDNLIGGLVTTDRKGIIETVNPAAERMFGYTAAELVGRHLGVLMPLAEGTDPIAYLREAMQKALGKVTEWAARRKDGSVFPMELGLAAFETANGRHFSGSVRDISERREIERMKKEFVSTVSHELRTPLTSIRGSLGLLAGGVLGELPEDAKEVIAVAERNVVRLVSLINDILDLERLDTGRLEMRLQMVPVAQILSRSLEAVRAFADAQSIRLECVSTAAAVFADADRLVQVLVNLLSNAIKFSPPGSLVSVRVAEGPAGTEIRVVDRGRGVPASHREAIFERFRQVESSDARQKGGTGLGLAISRAIIEQHGGSIGVESEEGQGSAFWIRLPAAAAPARAREEKGPVLPVSAGAGVLVVEDDPALANVISRQLAGLGVPARTAGTVSAGLALFRERAPDLVVLDVVLPDGDGYAFVRALRKEPAGRSLPLLVYTEQDLGTRDRDRLVLGPTRYLTKSRSSDAEFLDAVVQMLRAALAPAAV